MLVFTHSSRQFTSHLNKTIHLHYKTVDQEEADGITSDNGFHTDRTVQNYRVLKFIHNSGVAIYHQSQRQHECNDEDEGRDCLLGGVAAVCAPRYTGSLDDVAAHNTRGRHEHRLNDPDERNGTIHKTLLKFQLQSIRTHLCHSFIHLKK